MDDNRVFGLSWGSIDFESFQERIESCQLIGLETFGAALASRSNGGVLGGLGD